MNRGVLVVAGLVVAGLYFHVIHLPGSTSTGVTGSAAPGATNCTPAPAGSSAPSQSGQGRGGGGGRGGRGQGGGRGGGGRGGNRALSAPCVNGTSGGAAPAAGSINPSACKPSWATGGCMPVMLDDEFNGTSLSGTWTTSWFNGNGPVNGGECSSYNPSLVSVSGGYLHLGAYSIVSSNPSGGASPGFQFTYGSVEWRAYLPPLGSEIANWPALWLDGQHWPQDGEFDVVEGLHGSAAWHIPTDGNAGGQEGGGPGWHLFGVSWTSGGTVTFYHDGAQVGQVNGVPNNQPMYLIMGNQCGSSTQEAGTTMLVDWVRVWS